MTGFALQHPFLAIIFTAIISENIALYYFLGICPLISISSDFKTSWQMGVTVTMVMTLTVAMNWLIFNYLLKPNKIEFLQLLFFILTIAAVVQLLESFLDRFFPAVYKVFGIFLPLITVNCAILGVSMFAILREYDLTGSIVYATGCGIGWTLVICSVSSLRRRLHTDAIPQELGKIGITMIIAAVMALAFSGISELQLPGR
ncbi:MAG: NADH:ubiquinone reductase (Na(+)-transporting) subunit E [Candidatus Rifleibacteriota bacterium]